MIGAVVLAWVVVGSLVFVLPAVAWWVGSREGWNRVSTKVEPDLYREMVRRHSLRPAEAAEVEGAVTWGRELRDPRLRAAVVDWVESSRPARDPDSRPRPRWQRWLVLLAVVAYVVGVSAMAFRVGGWSGLLVVAVFVGSGPVVDRLVGRGPARALERNRGPAPS